MLKAENHKIFVKNVTKAIFLTQKPQTGMLADIFIEPKVQGSDYLDTLTRGSHNVTISPSSLGAAIITYTHCYKLFSLVAADKYYYQECYRPV